MSAIRTDRRGRVVKLVAFTLVMFAVTALFVVVDLPFDLSPFESPAADALLRHQLAALPVAGLALLITALFAGRVRLRYLSLRRTGPSRPLLSRSGEGRWETDGWYVALALTATITVYALVQVLPGGIDLQWSHVLLAVPFAASNAFVEEAIFRVPYVTMGENETNSRAYGLVMGSLVFGILHYWGGTPSGLLGAVMSAFLGFVLAKSMQETRGFFWAFTIHFMLDLPIFLLLLNQAS